MIQKIKRLQPYSFNHTVHHSFTFATLMLCICLVMIIIGVSLTEPHTFRTMLLNPLFIISIYGVYVVFGPAGALVLNGVRRNAQMYGRLTKVEGHTWLVNRKESW